MTRGSVLSHFASEIIEQTAACEAATDVAIQFKAGMNDPRRPLGVLLFCGPTGVGKTELAKSMSRFLFGASGGEISSSGVTSETATKPESPRMIRLDMSEYAGPWAADRLLMQSNGNHRTSCSRFVASRLRCCCWMRSRKLIRLFTTC
jgi:ATP-dependent Clp protease ATP-binding subunit ClpC